MIYSALWQLIADPRTGGYALTHLKPSIGQEGMLSNPFKAFYTWQLIGQETDLKPRLLVSTYTFDAAIIISRRVLTNSFMMNRET